jgi:hypothetical protein
MSKSLAEIVAAADWKELTPRLLFYAEKLIRRCPWQGIGITTGLRSEVSVEGYGPGDFVQEAIERFLSGQRTYNHSISLELNARGAIKSLIWSLNKSSRRTPTVPATESTDADSSEGRTEQVANAAAKDSIAEQKRMLEEFERSLAGQTELIQLLRAYKDDCTKPREVEKLTGIPAARVSELKRKLRLRLEQFETQAT